MVIKKRRGKFILYDRGGKKKLGSHDTKAGAKKQEYAIQKSKERRKK